MIGARSSSEVPSKSLDAFKRNQRSLVELASCASGIFSRLGREDRARSLAQLATRVDSEHCRVLVIGELKRGKSTLVNSLLGEEVLPTSVIPCTALISEIKWGERKRSLLHFRQSPQLPLPDGLPQDVMSHLRKEGSSPSPLEIPVERLADYLVIQEPWRDPTDATPEVPYSHVEVFWPAELLRHGVEIVDSPGLNSQSDRIARDYVVRANVILFVLGCNGLGSQSELRFIDSELREAEYEHLLFACNRFDEIKEKDLQVVMAYGREKLAGRTALGSDGVVFVSAHEALKARLSGDLALLERSGLPALERALTASFTSAHHLLKLLQPARELLGALDGARDEMRAQQTSLEQELAQLEAKVAKAKSEMEAADFARSRIAARIDQGRTTLRAAIRLEAERFLSGLAEGLEQWVASVDLQKEGYRGLSARAEAAAKEVCRAVGLRLGQEITEWRLSGLEPLVATRFTILRQDLSLPAAEFFSRVEKIRAVLMHLERSDGDRTQGRARGGEVSAEFLAQLFACGLLTRMLEGSSAIFLLPISLREMSRILPFAAGPWLRRFRGQLSRVLAGCLQAELDTLASSIAEEVCSRTREIARTAEEFLLREAQEVRAELHRATNSVEACKEHSATRMSLFSELEAEAQKLQSAAQQIIFDVIRDQPDPRPLQEKTKPRPHGSGTQKVLFLSADPFDMGQRLRIDVELRKIQEQLSRDDRFDLRVAMAARMEDLSRALLEHSPEIVHFAGHGDEDGVVYVLDDAGQAHAIAPDALAELFCLVSNRVRCVVLNCCYSSRHARAISKSIPLTIGMRTAIGDPAAIAFSVGFYQALRIAPDPCFESAFDFGRAQAGLVDQKEARNPVLYKGGAVVRKA